MNLKLFKNTLEIINKCFYHNEDITDAEFLYFLLGYKETDSENDKFLLSLEKPLANCLAGTKSLRAMFGTQYMTILSQSKKLKLEDLVNIRYKKYPDKRHVVKTRLFDMRKELLDLCKTYSLPCSGSETSEQLFANLFTACITEKSPRLFASQKKQQLKPATIKNTVGRSDDSEKLLQCLDQYHKIIIPGQHGSGKSRFIQYCLSIWGVSDYCYVPYVSDLASTKNNIRFYNDRKQGFMTSFDDFMDDSYSSSLLIIDHMNESADFSKELEELASYSTNVIVITTSNMVSDAFHIFRLSTLSDDTLMNIFKNISGISLTAKEEKLLFDISQRNILLISLIAGQYKQLSRHATDSSKIFSELLSVFDNALTNHLPLALGQSPTFKDSYTKKTLDIFGHIKSIYINFAEKCKNASLRPTMRFLCCFGYSTIPLSFLKLFSEYDQNAIDTLSDMGWILKTDSTIQLPSLIARSIFAVEIPSIADCSDLIDKMNDFLVNYDQTLSIPYLSNNLFVFVSSIHTKIKVKHNPNQKQASAKFENWQNLIYSIYYYYLENGNFQLAEKITQMIYYPNMFHKHNELDSSFFRLNIRMSLQDWTEKIPEEVDKLAALIENDETLLHANVVPFLITSMDIAIYLYCRCFFAYYNGIYTDNVDKLNLEDLKSYRFILFIAIGKILHNLPNPKYNGNAKISISQYEYYQLCHTLMSSPKCISSHLFEPFIQESTFTSSVTVDCVSQLRSETNANYRIRGIAFTMFMRSIYRKVLQFGLSASEYLTDPVNLIFTIRCDINKLHKQIIACEHIPWHTTWICLFCYLQLMAELSALYRKSNQPINMAYYSYMLRSLLDRSTFSEEELNEAYEKITQYFSL